MEFKPSEIIFYAGVWLFAFAAGLVRVVRDHDCQRIGDVFAVGFAGGFFGFGAVCIWVGNDLDTLRSPWFYWGVAALIGLLGKEQDKYLRVLISSLMKRFGTNDEPKP